MSNSKPHSSLSPNPSKIHSGAGKSLWRFGFLVTVLAPVLAAAVFYQLDSFDPVHYPPQSLSRQPLFVPRHNSRMLQGSEKIGFGLLLAPEDLIYDPKSKLICTGCADGWLKRVTVNESAADSAVEDWVNTGGRPLGLAVGHHGEVIVADAYKGLLKVSENGTIETLAREAEGLAFSLTDAVDIAKDGTIYFTDATYKYAISHSFFDFLEGRPHGRLMSYDPSTKRTKVLLKDLYFANGVAVSPDQTFVIICETPVRRCIKYYIEGERKGSVGMFVDNLPGLPDDIHYDGQGHYWIGIATGLTVVWDVALRYPFVRKVMAMMEKYVGWRADMQKAGVIAIDLEGKPAARYFDAGLTLVTSGIKIGDFLYCGSFVSSYILRLNLTQYPAVSST